jgi:hypothetical protein
MQDNIGRRIFFGATLAALAATATASIAQPTPDAGTQSTTPPAAPGGGPGETPGNAPGSGPSDMMHGRGNGPGAMMGNGPGMMQHGPGMMGHNWNTASYLDALKTQLGITEAQQPAWKDYADTLSTTAGQMQGAHETMFEAMGTASWQERRNMMNRMFDVRQQSFDTIHKAAGRLLPELDRTQQAKAQQILPGLRAHHGMMGMH